MTAKPAPPHELRTWYVTWAKGETEKISGHVIFFNEGTATIRRDRPGQPAYISINLSKVISLREIEQFGEGPRLVDLDTIGRRYDFTAEAPDTVTMWCADCDTEVEHWQSESAPPTLADINKQVKAHNLWHREQRAAAAASTTTEKTGERE